MSEEPPRVPKKIESILEAANARLKEKEAADAAKAPPMLVIADHPEKIRAYARIYFGLFVLGVAVCVLWFGWIRRTASVPEGTVIMLLSAIPFLGAAWHLDRGLKALRDLADSLQWPVPEKRSSLP